MNSFTFLLAASEPATETAISLGEKLTVGAEVALMGIAIVFSVLAILWGCLELFRVIFYEIPKKRKAKKTEAASSAQDKQPSDLAEAEEEQEDQGQILAAITAAIACATEQQPGSFRVVSFRRIDQQNRR